jgi:DNA repair protein RecN (Recombination protein N)
MLIELSITNFAIIEQVNLRFHAGFTVLSGETGAGKSIIIDALGMLRGDRFDASYIRTHCEKARIEGVFHVNKQSAIHQLLEDHGLNEEDEDQIIILREIARDTGRTITRINGRAVNNSVLREIGTSLIDIQGQHEGMSLFNSKTHLDMLDRFGKLMPLRQQVSEFVAQLRSIRQELTSLRHAAQQRNERIAELIQLRDDVSSAALVDGEEERLTQERALIHNGARITELVTSAYQLLNNDERHSRAFVTASVLLSQNLSDLAKIDPEAELLVNQSTDIQYAIEELLVAVRNYRDRIDFDPQRIEAIEDRITVLRMIQRKYRATINELIQRANQANEEIERLEHSAEHIAQLEQQEQLLRRKTGQIAQQLSTKRADSANLLSHAVEQSAHDLAMPHVRFQVQQQTIPAIDGIIITLPNGDSQTVAYERTGIDKVEFLIAPNPGEELKSLAKTASGGEGSRLFLALKAVLSQVDTVETMVFDEVDTGVGGRAGFVVGEKLWHISRHHQVLCISHLAQVATFGDSHFAITKRISAERTATQVTLLSQHDRIDEIAAMLDGHPVTDQSRLVARDMIHRAQQLKSSQTIQAVVPSSS